MLCVCVCGLVPISIYLLYLDYSLETCFWFWLIPQAVIYLPRSVCTECVCVCVVTCFSTALLWIVFYGSCDQQEKEC